MELLDWIRKKGLKRVELAKKLNLSAPFVTRLISGERQASPKVALDIERVTNGDVPRHTIRPDIWEPEEAA